MIYFDNAATSGKKPPAVTQAVGFALKNLSANPGRSGHKMSVRAADAVFKTREKIARFFGADGPEQVVFTLNCTHSINCVLKGILGKGEHVVISDQEHNAVMRPLKKIGATFTTVQCLQNAEQTVENFKNALRPNTKLVLVTGASNVTGCVLPIGLIGEICKNRGIYFCVDAAQIGGVLPIDMKKMNIDFLCLAPHKGLYAPMGIGVLICRKSVQNTVLEGGTGTDSFDFFQPTVLPEGLESGTVNVPGILGVGAGLDFVKKIGLSTIYKHEFSLLERLYSGLEKNENIILYTPKPVFGRTAPVLPFNYKGLDSFNCADILNEYDIAVRPGLHCAPTAHKCMGTINGGAVRVSFGVFNKTEEVDKLLNLLNSKKIIKK